MDNGRSSRERVAIAYITKWKGPIQVHKDMGFANSDKSNLWTGWQHIHPEHWTEDRDVAIQRWRDAKKAEVKRLERLLSKAKAALDEEPMFEEK